MSDQWSLMNNWNLVLPPSRPSVNQLEYLRSIANNINKELSVAILGSTPEFRDLFYELGFKNIFIFDRNKEFYDNTSKYRIYNNKEIFVHGDWLLTLEEHINQFSLIVSDLTSGNIPYEERKKFYRDIENALTKGGYFYDKVLTHQDNFKSVAILLDKYEKMPLNNLSANYFSCELLFCSELLKESMKVDTSLFYQIIENLSKSKRIHKFIDLSKLITPPGFTWYYGKNWGDLKMEYCPNLKELNEIDDNNESPYYGFLKIFNLKK
jgi:hypothetical protein